MSCKGRCVISVSEADVFNHRHHQRSVSAAMATETDIYFLCMCPKFKTTSFEQAISGLMTLPEDEKLPFLSGRETESLSD